jgi:hypothetical protein
VLRLRDELNITHNLPFGLCDADSAQQDPFHQFGICATTTHPSQPLRRSTLIRELGT